MERKRNLLSPPTASPAGQFWNFLLTEAKDLPALSRKPTARIRDNKLLSPRARAPPGDL